MMFTQNQHCGFKLDQPQKELWEYLYRLIGSFIILSFRYFLTRFVFVHVGVWFGLKDFKRKKPPANPILERAYYKSKKWTPEEILGLSKRLDMSQDEVRQWLCLKSSQNRVTILEKFVDSHWKACFYSFELLCGIVVLWDKHWVWDINECWDNLYNHNITNDVWWYFMLSTSHSWSQLFGLIFEVKRKDFSITIIHHLVVIFLSIIWIRSNMFRLGAVVSLVSNFPEAFLEVSKMAKYLEYEKVAVHVFFVFSVLWVIVRLGIHPFWMRSYFVDVPKIVPPIFTHSIYCVMGFFFVIFFLLNCVWSYFVVRAATQIFVKGTLQDSRSDSEDAD